MKTGEKVLVFPASLIKEIEEKHGAKLEFHNGFVNILWFIGFYNSILESNNLFFMDRATAETDENFKQIIPYLVVKQKNKYFAYKRTKKAGDKRLHDLWSVGVGGHINPIDGDMKNGREIFYAGLKRELKEELGVELSDKDFDERITIQGAIYDDSNEVGRVHFGFFHIVELPDETFIEGKDPAISNGDFEKIETIQKNVDMFENWSKIVIPYLS